MRANEQKEFAKKWTGLVDVISGESVAKLTSRKQNKDGKPVSFPNDEMTLKVKLADLPKEAKKVIKAEMDKPITVRVRLNEDGDAIETVTPARGVFTGCKLIGLGPKDKDGNWRPLIHKVFNEGTAKENHHDEFIAIYEIQTGVFKGVELPGYYLHYKFMEIPEGQEDEGMTKYSVADTPQAKQLHKLQQWAATQGNILDENIVWPDDGDIRNVMEERALDADVSVTLIFNDGYIDSVQPDVEYGDPEPETEEEFELKFAEVKEVPLDDGVEEVPAKEKESKPAKKKLKKTSDEEL